MHAPRILHSGAWVLKFPERVLGPPRDWFLLCAWWAVVRPSTAHLKIPTVAALSSHASADYVPDPLPALAISARSSAQSAPSRYQDGPQQTSTGGDLRNVYFSYECQPFRMIGTAECAGPNTQAVRCLWNGLRLTIHGWDDRTVLTRPLFLRDSPASSVRVL
jgi:hypothetical protein